VYKGDGINTANFDNKFHGNVSDRHLFWKIKVNRAYCTETGTVNL
jgi:hypothetical protein